MIAHGKRGLRPLARLCTALRFLTLLPISWRAEEDGHHFGASLPYFILVGALIGITVAILALGGQYLLPQAVTAMLAVTMLAGVSGFLHLDGLSDSFDGLLSSRSREASLAIMKDSRAGAMGIVAVVVVLLTKFAALASVPAARLPQSLFLMALGGRCAILVMMAILPYARKEGGLGALFYCGKSKKAGFLAIVVLIVSILVVAPGQLVAVFVVLSLLLLLFCRWCLKKLGGATGDTLGAVCELAETAVAVAMTVTLPPYSS